MANREIRTDAQGNKWVINWRMVELIYESFCLEISINSSSKELYTTEARWYNPVSWSVPGLCELEIDWDSVYKKKMLLVEDMVGRLRRNKQMTPLQLIRDLESIIGQTGKFRKQRLQKLRILSQRNRESLKRSVSAYTGLAAGSRFIRDTATDTLLVGATMVSGPAGLAIAAGGAGLSGVGKAQDTGNVAAGIINGVNSFLFTAIPIGKAKSSMYMLQNAVYDSVLIILEIQVKYAEEMTLKKTSGENISKASVETLTGKLPVFVKELPSVSRLFKKATQFSPAAKLAGGFLEKKLTKVVADKLNGINYPNATPESPEIPYSGGDKGLNRQLVLHTANLRRILKNAVQPIL